MLDEIFKNQRGIYQVDSDTGLFTIKNKRSVPKYFIGSIDPIWDISTSDNSLCIIEENSHLYRETFFLLNFFIPDACGFSPEFKEGWRPLGLICDIKDISLVADGIIRFSDDIESMLKTNSANIKYELGSKIEKVYRQLQSHERKYPFESSFL